ncbi:hypothetical protein A3C78_00750 [Candidatus Azambacteria bacterium RIFCSPHIGHO2_02_FULL_45_18]|nr:MAG: hypothetical protein A3C78_00750 [Candidatus Azambacteria bacterium RIFCSPHIGHO2_02_FULL_45_18]
MAKVYFTKPAEKDLKHLSLSARESLRDEHVPLLAENPHVGKLLHGPLRGYFSYDFHVEGIAYRIAYEINKGDVIILMINTRENFYKKFTRRVR